MKLPSSYRKIKTKVRLVAVEAIFALTGIALNLEALQLLDKWLQKLQACIGQDSALWMKVLYERYAFWEIIGSIYFRVFSRR